VSAVFSDSQSRRQLTLDIDQSMLERFRSLRECMAQGVYQRGLTRVAGELDKSPGNLSTELGGESQRKLGVDDLEAYIQKFNDKTPIYYLIARYLGDETAARDQALGQVAQILQDLPGMLAAAGLPTAIKTKARR
jgi:hypothetical protein